MSIHRVIGGYLSWTPRCIGLPCERSSRREKWPFGNRVPRTLLLPSPLGSAASATPNQSAVFPGRDRR